MTIDPAAKCAAGDRLLHNAGSDPDCPTCRNLPWEAPVWQLRTPHGVFDYYRRPLNPLVRLVMFSRGYRWRRNPAIVARGNPVIDTRGNPP